MRALLLWVAVTASAAVAQPIAITDVVVVDVAAGAAVPGQTVVVDGDRIAAVGPSASVAVPVGAVVVDGADRFLIPGLWDMHAHTSSDRITREIVYPLLIAHGVTGIRNMMGDCFEAGPGACGPVESSAEEARARRRDVEAGRLTGPHEVVGSAPADGSGPGGISSTQAAGTPESARAFVRLVHERGVDFVKVYDGIPRDAYFALAHEAARLGLPIAGHVPVAVRASEASDTGQRSIEHCCAGSLLEECSAREAELRPRVVAELASDEPDMLPLMLEMVASYDAYRCAGVFARFVENGTWVTPTLMVGRLPDEFGSGWDDDPRLRYLPPEERAYFASAGEANDALMGDAVAQEPYTRWARRVLREMHEAGVRLLAGSDAGDPGVFWGSGLHEELILLVGAGLTEAEALRAATLWPAEYFAATDSLGTVTEGKVADLVLLDADPLDDIAHTQRIRAVVAGGRLFDRAALDGLLAGVERAAQDPARSDPDPVAEWLAAHADRLDTVDPEAPPADLEPLRAIVGDARVVVLGEPTHGNREVYQLKDRIVRFLVEVMGFDAVVLETPMSETEDVEAFVGGGAGTPETALAATHVWPWDTEEVAALLAWARAHNADAEQPLRVYGFDMQSPERAARATLAALDRVDPALAAEARAALGHLAIPFSDPEAGGYRPIVDRDFDATVQEAVAAVIAAFGAHEAAFGAHEAAWTAAVGADAWARARQHAHVLGQWAEANRDGGRRYTAVRDSSMAENIRWVLDREGPGSRVVVWTHNSHAADAPHRAGTGDRAGRHLRRALGDAVVTVGVLFGRGGFTALDAATPSPGVVAFEVGPSPPETVDARFATAGLDLAAVDLRDLPADGPVAEWFAEPRPFRDSGGGYDPAAPERYVRAFVLPEAFDALVYVGETTPTRMVEPADYGAFPVLTAPVNLGFEHGVVGEAPAGWLVWSKLRRFEFEIATTDRQPYRGRRAAVVRRPPGREIGEASGSVLQQIDAAPYHGRRVRLRAAVRAELADGGLAFLRLRVLPSELGAVHGVPPPPPFDSLDRHRVTSPDWRVLDIEADVAEGAGVISYGVFLAGAGAVWLDDVSLTVVE